MNWGHQNPRLVTEQCGTFYKISISLLWRGKPIACMTLLSIIQSVITRDTVMMLLRQLDQDSVLRRRKRRLQRRIYISQVCVLMYWCIILLIPAFVLCCMCSGPRLWHLDDYDKLAPYGFYSHGCIDGWVLNWHYIHVIITYITCNDTIVAIIL